MIIGIKAKDIIKNGNGNICEYNLANNTLTIDFNSSRFINGDFTFKIPEIDIPKDVKSIKLEDISGGISLVVTSEELIATLKDGYFEIPYKEWLNTKNKF